MMAVLHGHQMHADVMEIHTTKVMGIHTKVMKRHALAMEMHTKVMQIQTKVMEMHEKQSKFKSKRNSCKCNTCLLLAVAVAVVNSRSGGAPGT